MRSRPVNRRAGASQPAIELPQSRYARWRAATLLLVYLAMVGHYVHWRLAGKTLAPLELNEVMYTLELGIVTAGFVFMSVAVLATAVFGRFFCSWGCHILALQDLSAWILEKCHIRPKPVRSRALLWVPVVVMLYMFIWPQVTRLWEGRPLPTLHLADDAEGWASFVTSEFARNLPGPFIAGLTFLVCGFFIVYVLGSRGFCTYGCPYGAVFGLADRIAPGRIRASASCENCGICTAVCSSHVRVHEEIARYGMVVSPRCLKDLDCVSACPDGQLRYGFGAPSLIARPLTSQRVKRSYDFAWWEDAVMTAVVLAVILVFRGLYDLVPFLMTVGLGSLSAYLVVLALRLAYRPSVRFNRWQLKLAGRLSASGYAFVLAMGLFAALAAHSGFVRYHSVQGRRFCALAGAGGVVTGAPACEGMRHLQLVDRWGLLRTPRDDVALAHLYVARAGERYEASRIGEAVGDLREATRLHPNLAAAHRELGTLLLETGSVAAGVDHLQIALHIDPTDARAQYNLAVALAMSGRMTEAVDAADRAGRLDPDDAQSQALLAELRRIAGTHP